MSKEKVYILQKELPQTERLTSYYLNGDHYYPYRKPDGSMFELSDGKGFSVHRKWVEDNPTWFQEEVKKDFASNDSFQWDDSKVKELLWNRFPFPEGVTSVQPILDEFKKNYQPKPQADNKPDWEIVAYRFVPLSKMDNAPIVTSISKFWKAAVNGDPNYEIHSVFRREDGETFSVGDEVVAMDMKAKIRSFVVHGDNHLYVCIGEDPGGYSLSHLKKSSPQPQKEEQGAYTKPKIDPNPPIYSQQQVDAMCEDAALKFMHYTEHIMEDDDWMDGEELKSMSQVYKEFTQWKNQNHKTHKQ